MFENQNSGSLRLFGLGWLGIAAIFFVVQLTTSPSVVIAWAIGSEQETAGFHIYRSESKTGPFNRINKTLISAEGSTVRGAKYEFIDYEVVVGTTYFYQLEEVELDARASRYTNSTIKHHASRLSWWEVMVTAVSALIGFILLTSNRKNKTV